MFIPVPDKLQLLIAVIASEAKQSSATNGLLCRFALRNDYE
jgi:hypothetical protein